jgi:hypothetical protein
LNFKKILEGPSMVVPILDRLKQEDPEFKGSEFEARMGYIGKNLSQKNCINRNLKKHGPVDRLFPHVFNGLKKE